MSFSPQYRRNLLMGRLADTRREIRYEKVVWRILILGDREKKLGEQIRLLDEELNGSVQSIPMEKF